MIPKEKSKELVDNFKELVAIDTTYDDEPIFKLQKQCALICVEEIIAELKFVHRICGVVTPSINWVEVKKEIEKL